MANSKIRATLAVSGRTMLPAGLLQVVFVITIVNPHLTMINFEDAIDETAQEVAVMADEHNRAGKVLQCGKQRLYVQSGLRRPVTSNVMLF